MHLRWVTLQIMAKMYLLPFLCIARESSGIGSYFYSYIVTFPYIDSFSVESTCSDSNVGTLLLLTPFGRPSAVCSIGYEFSIKKTVNILLYYIEQLHIIIKKKTSNQKPSLFEHIPSS